jgi:4-hydroxy-tetrahydrodipicolinate synthase
MTQYRPRGVYVPLITPFAADGTVAYDAIEGLIHRYADAGVTGIVALGTTGEPATLTPEEKQGVVDRCSAICVERSLELMIGAGSNSTSATIAAMHALQSTPGLRAFLIVSPYYVRPSEAGIVAHFSAVAAATSQPIVLYNVPARTGRNMSASAILQCSQLRNVVGIKQAVGSLDEETLQVLAQASEDFAVLSGDDAFIAPLVLMGGTGAIAATAHLATATFVAMVSCAQQGKIDDARSYAASLLPLVQTGFAEPNPTVFKGVLHSLGWIPTADVRLPLVPASAAAVDATLAVHDALPPI